MSTKILLVDDEPDVEGMIKLKFRHQIKAGDYEFIFARDGKDALDKLDMDENIDIVISDINMPEMDGLTLLNHLNHLDRILKAIIVSAYGDMDNIRTAMNRGAYDFLTKPINFEDLQITIEKTRKTIENVKSNIENLHKAEASLADTNAKFSSIVNTAVDAIITIDSKGRIYSVNPSAEKLFGYSADELHNGGISILFSKENMELFETFSKELLINHVSDKLSGNDEYRDFIAAEKKEYNLYRKNETKLPVELTISDFESSGRNMFTVIMRDITLRKEAEKILKEYNHKLEEKVKERTKELVQSNNEKNEILGVAAHDLKNPLSNIKMLAKLLKEDLTLSKDEIKEFSDDILNTSERMFELIKNLLDINAIEQGKINLDFENFDFAFEFSVQINNYIELAKNKNIDIHYSNNLSNSTVFADRSATMQIIDNLLSNAVKYSPFNKEIFISLDNYDDNFICFSVKDQGPGISEEDKKKLFQKFSRLSAKPTGGEHSTGLGLSIVKKLINLMGGEAFCESELGKGAKFVATFKKAAYIENLN